jgi:glycosyltransferase involved in cell wall biosynthesis
MKSMGYDNNLLYWNKILQELYHYENDISVYTRDTSATVDNTNIVISKIFTRNKFRTLGEIPKIINIFRKKEKPVVIVSEFNEVTLVAAIARILVRRSKLVLLIENHPRYLIKYKIRPPSKILSYINRVYRCFITDIADVVVANTAHAEEYILKELSVPSRKVIQSMYLTSSMGKLNSRTYCQENRFVTFISVGRIDHWKGFDLMVAAIGLLDDDIRSQCRFVFIGNGPERESIEINVREKKLTHCINFIGSVSFNKMRDWYLKADVAVITTRADYRSLVGFEAISCGLPVIGSIYDGASNEVVVEGYNGFVLDPVNISALAEKIVWFAENPNRISSMGRNSLDRAKLYSLDNAVNNIYRAALSA